MTKIKLTSAADLKARFKKIIPFMSKEEARYYLCGVYLEYNGYTLTATATNGHILCTMDWQLSDENEVQKSFAVICPDYAVKHLSKVITAKKKSDGGVILEVLEDGIIKFEFSDFKYETVAINGSFPDYRSIIPKDNVRLNAGLDASYLINVLHALDKKPVNISVADGVNAEYQAHLFSSDDELGIKCVVMPKRA